MKKKFLCGLLALLSTFAFSLSASACEDASDLLNSILGQETPDGGKDECVHDWGEWTVVTEPTCETDGEKTRVCKLDETHIENETVSALGHDIETHEGKATTCTEAGWEEYQTCKREGCEYTTYAELSVDHATNDCGECMNLYYEKLPNGGYKVVGYSKARQELVIPAVYKDEAVTAIGSEAFKDCVGLESLEIPDSVTLIAGDAFSGCAIKKAKGSLYAISFIPQAELVELVVTSGSTIVRQAFKDCAKLETLVIDGSVSEIFAEAFYGLGGLRNLTVSIDAMNVDCFGSVFGNASYEGSVAIAQPLDQTSGYSVNYFPQNLSCLTLNGEGTIKRSFFYNCHTLTDLIIGDSVEYIDDYAFYNCHKLQRIEFGESIKTVGDSSFGECVSVAEVVIPESFTGIHVGAFSDGANKLDVYYEGDIAGWCAMGFTKVGAGFDLYIDGELLTELIIPDTVTKIGAYAFAYCSNFRNAVFGSGLQEVGEYAFYNCWNLQTVTIARPILTVGTNAFLGCTKLVELYSTEWGEDSPSAATVPAGMNSYLKNTYTIGRGKSKVFNENGYILYKDGESVIFLDYAGEEIDLVIPEGVTEIYPYALINGENITSILLPASLQTIGAYAFTNCYRLTEIYNKSALQIEIDDEAYGRIGRFSVKVYNEPQENKIVTDENGFMILEDGEKVILVGYTGEATEVVIPDSVTEIKNGAFRNCRRIESVKMGDSVTKIGSYAFEGCLALERIGFGKSVTSIGKEAFKNCLFLSDLVFPESLITIGDYAFSGCCGLGSIEIGVSVTTIGEYAFAECKGLTRVVTKDSLVSIGQKAFYACEDLEYIKLGESVQTLGGEVFAYCAKLSSITFPASVTEIGQKAFYNCSSFKSALFKEKTGWYVYSSATATSGSSVSSNNAGLGNQQKAAGFLRDTYCSRYWKRKA